MTSQTFATDASQYVHEDIVVCAGFQIACGPVSFVIRDTDQAGMHALSANALITAS